MSGPITLWLQRLGEGDSAALDQLVPLLYDELRGVARRLLRGERPGQTLSTTTLVNETYIRLLEARHLAPSDRAAFLAVAAVTMRRLLVDAAHRVVELRFFAGLSLEETAATLALSTKTVQRDWLAARAWLRAEVVEGAPLRP